LISLQFAAMSSVNAREAAPRPTVAGPGNATIYIMRQHEFKLFRFTFDVFVDGQKAGQLTAGTYLVAVRRAGHQSIDIKGDKLWTGDMHAEMDAGAGQTYFVELGPPVDMPGRMLMESLLTGGSGLRGQPLPGNGAARFFLLNADEARTALSGLKTVGR
jgi:Protein of unknown function (DUF2846)